MKVGGFDAIIGNPPYGAYFGDDEKKYIKEKYDSYKYRYDSYSYFIEKGLRILNRGGFLSFITPELWLRLENNAPLHHIIASKSAFDKLRICGEDVFINSIVNTIVFRLQNDSKAESIHIETKDKSWYLPTITWQSADGYVIDYRIPPDAQIIINKVVTSSQFKLGDFGDIIQGITPYDRYRGQSPELIKNRGYHFQDIY
jgi:hypothetical protein